MFCLQPRHTVFWKLQQRFRDIPAITSLPFNCDDSDIHIDIDIDSGRHSLCGDADGAGGKCEWWLMIVNDDWWLWVVIDDGWWS